MALMETEDMHSRTRREAHTHTVKQKMCTHTCEEAEHTHSHTRTEQNTYVGTHKVCTRMEVKDMCSHIQMLGLHLLMLAYIHLWTCTVKFSACMYRRMLGN